MIECNIIHVLSATACAGSGPRRKIESALVARGRRCPDSQRSMGREVFVPAVSPKFSKPVGVRGAPGYVSSRRRLVPCVSTLPLLLAKALGHFNADKARLAGKKLGNTNGTQRRRAVV